MRPTLTHIAIQVPDVEACIAFYRDFCDLEVIHRRAGGVAWLAEPGKESEFVFVLLPGGGGRDQAGDVWDHLGFACASKAEVDDVAARGRSRLPGVGAAAGRLPRRLLLRPGHPTVVEFSYGQPLGPGAGDVGQPREPAGRLRR